MQQYHGESINRSNYQRFNSLVNMFRGMFVSSVPDRISNIVITINDRLPRFEPVATISHFTIITTWSCKTIDISSELTDQLTDDHKIFEKFIAYNITMEKVCTMLFIGSQVKCLRVYVMRCLILFSFISKKFIIK